MIPRAADGAIAINTKAKALFDKGKIRARIREIETVHHGVITGYIRELQAAHREAMRLLSNPLIATYIREF